MDRIDRPGKLKRRASQNDYPSGQLYAFWLPQHMSSMGCAPEYISWAVRHVLADNDPLLLVLKTAVLSVVRVLSFSRCVPLACFCQLLPCAEELRDVLEMHLQRSLPQQYMRILQSGQWALQACS